MNPRSQLVGRSIFSSRWPCGGAGVHGEAPGVEVQPRRAVGAQRLELLVQVLRVIDVGRPQRQRLRRAEALPPAHAQAAVGGFVLGEALEEDDVVGHRDDRVAGHQLPPEGRVVLGQVTGVSDAGGPVLLAGPVEVSLQAGRERRAAPGFDFPQRIAVSPLPQRRLLPRLPRLPLPVGGLVLLHVAEVADDYIVQRADGLAEPQRVPQRRVKRHRLPRQVGRETDGGGAPGCTSPLWPAYTKL